MSMTIMAKSKLVELVTVISRQILTPLAFCWLAITRALLNEPYMASVLDSTGDWARRRRVKSIPRNAKIISEKASTLVLLVLLHHDAISLPFYRLVSTPMTGEIQCGSPRS